MRNLVPTALLALSVGAGCSPTDDPGSEEMEMMSQSRETEAGVANLHTIPFKTIMGDVTSLEQYKGQVVLIVNVASQCGFTKQYADLEELYRMYKDSGLVVLGFPANNFGDQEPGSNEEILNFCQTRFDVTFPMMAKVSVKGKDKHPLFVELTGHPEMAGEIKWNFSKFLLDRNGHLVARFGSRTKPTSDKIVAKLKELL
jgi:glutathione peroxidase